MASSISFLSPELRINEDNIDRVIFDLQAIGERKTFQNQSKASLYIKNRLREIGLNPQVDIYHHNNQDWENIWVEFEGTNEEKKKIVVIAHYDSTSRNLAINAPGADDNASGVSLLLELARGFETASFLHDILLVFVSNEEHGRAGSKNYAEKLKDENAIVSGVLNIDIVGYDNPGAIFSKELPGLFRLDLPLKRKAIMMLKMLYNYSVNVAHSGKKFKIEGRILDKLLHPENFGVNEGEIAKTVKWKFGDMCA